LVSMREQNARMYYLWSTFVEFPFMPGLRESKFNRFG
jgi:hypothetical protein